MPTCTAAAPSAKATATPRRSAMPPAAMPEPSRRQTIWGTSATVPSCGAMSSSRKLPRCPPASRPIAITASTPRVSSQRASATVVAEDNIFAFDFLTRSSNVVEGKPKWKLTTSGRYSSTISHKPSSKDARRPRLGAFRDRGRAQQSKVRAARPRPLAALDQVLGACGKRSLR